MSLEVQGINYTQNVAPTAVQKSNHHNSVAFKGDTELPEDTFVPSNKPERTKEEKEEILSKANSNSSGWSIFGGVISTIYYAARSDQTIADKYNLDVNADKDFIKEIRKSQVLWTVPGLFGFGLPAWIVSKCI